MGGVHPAFWMPAIHAGMTDCEWIDGAAPGMLTHAFDFTSMAKMRIADLFPTDLSRTRKRDRVS